MKTNPPENFPAPWASAWGEDSFGDGSLGFWQAFEIKGVQQIMRWIPQGEFLMGSPDDEAERFDNESQHKVIIEQGFWLADTACTQALWLAVMGENPSDFKDDLQNPVEMVSWDQCQDFIEKANQLLADNFFYLPREAQWEYACRAGTHSAFNTGDNITSDQANYDGNHPYNEAKKEAEKGEYREKTVPVVSFAPNDWGLYQMHGNVWEWCEDVYSEDYSLVKMTKSSERVVRGGCWLDDARLLRSADRDASTPDYRNHDIGFRLAGGFDPQASKQL